MKNLVANIFISLFLLINSIPALAFDFAPEIGDIAPNFNLKGLPWQLQK